MSIRYQPYEFIDFQAIFDHLCLISDVIKIITHKTTGRKTQGNAK